MVCGSRGEVAFADRDCPAQAASAPVATRPKHHLACGRIIVPAVAKPEPDRRKLALAFLGLAREMQAEDRVKAA